MPLITLFQGKDKNVVVPKIIGSNSLEHILLTDNTLLIKNKWQIPEPTDGMLVPESKIEVVFVPLLAVDEHGNRVGYGKGYYDGFLKKCSEKTIKIGLSLLGIEKEPISDTHENDVRLDYCINPEGISKF